MDCKTCPKCKQEKPLSDFGLVTKSKDGKATYCRPCAAAHRRNWRASLDFETGRLPVKLYAIQKNYGLNRDQFFEMLERQHGQCAICEQPLDLMTDRGMNVDHDHQTREVRALLCGGCNLGLGIFKEDPDRLEAAARYIRAWQDPRSQARA